MGIRMRLNQNLLDVWLASSVDLALFGIGFWKIVPAVD
jgi:hypothetical protein